jgi:hypothetical protein
MHVRRYSVSAESGGVESALPTESIVRYDCLLCSSFVVCCHAMGPVMRVSTAHLTVIACLLLRLCAQTSSLSVLVFRSFCLLLDLPT